MSLECWILFLKHLRRFTHLRSGITHEFWQTEMGQSDNPQNWVVNMTELNREFWRRSETRCHFKAAVPTLFSRIFEFINFPIVFNRSHMHVIASVVLLPGLIWNSKSTTIICFLSTYSSVIKKQISDAVHCSGNYIFNVCHIRPLQNNCNGVQWRSEMEVCNAGHSEGETKARQVTSSYTCCSKKRRLMFSSNSEKWLLCGAHNTDN